jgi:hypothetical protein
MKAKETQNKEQKTQNTEQSRPAGLLSSAFCILYSAFCILLFGCSNRILSVPLVTPKQPSAMAGIASICLVEPHNNTTYPQISGQVTECLYQAIQKKHLFNLSVLRQTEPAWKNLPILPDSVYTFEQLSATRKILGVDAVIIGAVTSYSPYPNMAIGIKLKMIDLRDARVCWTIDHVWDTADKTTESKLKKYFDRQLRGDYSPLNEQLAVLSSLNFLKFVTYDIAETLGP